jgi:hypothetical protein
MPTRVVELERLGIPVTWVNWIYPGLDSIAKNACERQGMPAIMQRIFYIKSDYNPNIRAQYELRQLIDIMTRPLTDEEMKSDIVPRHEPPRIACEGTYEDTIKVFEGDLKIYPSGGPWSCWTDGLPIVPPTEERVKNMLSGTSHSPDEIVGRIQPEGWEATVEKVAINGVMAGCRPEHMPVLLAIAELGPAVTYSSPCSFSILWAVSGPYAQEIQMNSGYAVLSPGNPANATIGRAATLMAINLGGVYPSVNMIKQIGHPADYSCCITEVPDEKNPWSPVRDDWGYKRSESVLFRFESFWVAFLHCASGTKPLQGAEELPSLNNLLGMLANQHLSIGTLFLMTPMTAEGYVRMGFRTKQSFQEWLWYNATQPKREWVNGYWFVYERRRVQPSGTPKAWNEDMLSWPDETQVPRFPNPKYMGVLVTGGNGYGLASIHMGNPEHTLIDKWR